MRRTASEILQGLEDRVAKLEMLSKKAHLDRIDSPSLESELIEMIYLKYNHHIPSGRFPILVQQQSYMIGYTLYTVDFDKYHAVVKLRGRQYSLLFVILRKF